MSYQNIKDLIDHWPKPVCETFASDINATVSAVKSMRRRNSISVKHWPLVIEAAVFRNIPGVDEVNLTKLMTDQAEDTVDHLGSHKKTSGS